MIDGESKTGPRYLEANEVVVAECDSNCSDIDLILYDESGEVVSVDSELDAVPVVQAPYEGVFTVEAIMTSCSSSNGCNALVRYGDADFSEPSELTFFELTSSYEETSRYEETSYGLGEGSFLMIDGESKIGPRYLEANEIVVAECDSNCSDMDLILYDESGEVVSVDSELDAVPVVQAPYEGVFTVEAIMTSCSSSNGCNALVRYGDADFSEPSELTFFELGS